MQTLGGSSAQFKPALQAYERTEKAGPLLDQPMEADPTGHSFAQSPAGVVAALGDHALRPLSVFNVAEIQEVLDRRLNPWFRELRLQ